MLFWLQWLCSVVWSLGGLYLPLCSSSSGMLWQFWVSYGSIWILGLFILVLVKNIKDILVVQFSSVAQLCLTLCGPMNRSTPGLPVHHQLPESTQTHAHRVGDAIQPSHPLSSPSPTAPNPSQHQGLFQWVNSSHEVAKVLEFQLQALIKSVGLLWIV